MCATQLPGQILNINLAEGHVTAQSSSSSIVLQATPFAERKGLVTLQPLSCCRETQLSNTDADIR